MEQWQRSAWIAWVCCHRVMENSFWLAVEQKETERMKMKRNKYTKRGKTMWRQNWTKRKYKLLKLLSIEWNSAQQPFLDTWATSIGQFFSALKKSLK